MKDFDSYTIQYASSNFEKAGIHFSKPLAVIQLYKDKLIGRINFEEELVITANSIDDNGIMTLNFHIDRFNDIINILRYEKPLFLYMNTHALTGNITTRGLEPVGEEENNEGFAT